MDTCIYGENHINTDILGHFREESAFFGQNDTLKMNERKF
jgi:hypothetical protein